MEYLVSLMYIFASVAVYCRHYLLCIAVRYFTQFYAEFCFTFFHKKV